MADLKILVSRVKSSSMSIDKLCKVKKYIPVQEKFKFVDEYDQALEERIHDYENYESFIAFIIFNLMVVKYYTDIKLDLTYEEFDILQQNGIIDRIVEYVGADYSLLLKVVDMGSVRRAK